MPLNEYRKGFYDLCLASGNYFFLKNSSLLGCFSFFAMRTSDQKSPDRHCNATFLHLLIATNKSNKSGYFSSQAAFN